MNILWNLGIGALALAFAGLSLAAMVWCIGEALYLMEKLSNYTGVFGYAFRHGVRQWIRKERRKRGL